MKIGKDKWKHYGVGCIIGFFASYFGILAGLAIPFVIGAAKEAYDYRSENGCCESLDIVFTYLGGATGCLIGTILIDILNSYGIIIN